MRTQIVRGGTLLSVLFLAASYGKADPVITLTSQAQFQTAITSGFLAGVDAAGNGAGGTNFNGSINFATAANPAPLGKTDISTSPNISAGRGGEVSSTKADLGKRTTGAISYRNDPDYTNFSIDLDFYFPQVGVGMGIDTFSIALLDTTGRTKYWQWGTAALTQGFQDFTFGLNQGAGAGGSTAFGQQPGFDITQTQAFAFIYTGTLTGTYPPIPVTVNNLPDGTLWTGADKLVVDVPEPGAWSVCGIGLLGACLLRRTRLRRR